MSNSKAFIKDIGPIGSGVDENESVHQTSPAWVLTFQRWTQRDTLRTSPTEDTNYLSITGPLVVESDCIQCSTADSKGVLTPSMNATLMITDINYATAVSPGDFVFVNMLNWESDARTVAEKARKLQSINGVNDGFKGIYKIQSVRKSLVSDANSGTKVFVVRITAYAFTEFNNSVYFNQYLISETDQNLAIYNADILSSWAALVSQKALTNIQDISKALIEAFIGSGVGDGGLKDATSLLRSPNVQFLMPKGVGQLLGVTGLTAAKDAFTYLFGIQQYASGSKQSLGSGMNPVGAPAPDDSRFVYCSQKVEGNMITKAEYWNQVKLWSILGQYSNSPINELYTCFRVTANNRVMPTVVLRQIPFTTDDFDAGSATVTRFMNLPRWRVSPTLSQSFDLGRDEAARINFVQYFGRSTIGPEGVSISEEIARKNFVFDRDDVKRNGLRPYVTTSQFDEPTSDRGKSLFRSPYWAKIVGDALIGGHLKMNGSIDFYGIQDPIAVGDNLEFDDVVYHIESITHSCQLAPDGKKSFKTKVSLSNGVSTASSASGVKYDEMSFGGAYKYRKNDFDHSEILPGISESQNTVYRSPEDLDNPTSISSSFEQPDTATGINKTGRDS